MQAEQQQTINKHIQQLGFADIYAFALEQLIAINEKQLAESKEKIADFEKKYKMNYEAFDKNFHSIDSIDLFEKEDDGMDWEMEQHFAEAAEQELVNLKNLREDDDQ